MIYFRNAFACVFVFVKLQRRKMANYKFRLTAFYVYTDEDELVTDYTAFW